MTCARWMDMDVPTRDGCILFLKICQIRENLLWSRCLRVSEIAPAGGRCRKLQIRKLCFKTFWIHSIFVICAENWSATIYTRRPKLISLSEQSASSCMIHTIIHACADSMMAIKSHAQPIRIYLIQSQPLKLGWNSYKCLHFHSFESRTAIHEVYNTISLMQKLYWRPIQRKRPPKCPTRHICKHRWLPHISLTTGCFIHRFHPTHKVNKPPGCALYRCIII